jgi:hypothetical protein
VLRDEVNDMKMLSSVIAAASLFLTVGSLLVIGGAAFALILFFPLFVLALVVVLAALEDTTVREHNPSMSPSGWRDQR